MKRNVIATLIGVSALLSMNAVCMGASNCANGDKPGDSGSYWPDIPDDEDHTQSEVIVGPLNIPGGGSVYTRNGGYWITYYMVSTATYGGGEGDCGVGIVVLQGSVTTTTPPSITISAYGADVTFSGSSTTTLNLGGRVYGGAAQPCRLYEAGIAEINGRVSFDITITVVDNYGDESESDVSDETWVAGGGDWHTWEYCGS